MTFFNLTHKKYSIIDGILFSSSCFLTYVVYIQQSQQKLLMEQCKILTEHVSSIEQQQNELFLTLKNIDQEILELKNQILKSISSTDILLLAEQNQHNQFLIKTAGVAVLRCGLIVLTMYVFPNMFSFEYLIPKKAFYFLQNYTPFFQQVDEYFLNVMKHDSIFKVIVKNKKIYSIKAKSSHDLEYIDINVFLDNFNKVSSSLSEPTVTNILVDTTTVLLDNSERFSTVCSMLEKLSII